MQTDKDEIQRLNQKIKVDEEEIEICRIKLDS